MSKLSDAAIVNSVMESTRKKPQARKRKEKHIACIDHETPVFLSGVKAKLLADMIDGMTEPRTLGDSVWQLAVVCGVSIGYQSGKLAGYDTEETGETIETVDVDDRAVNMRKWQTLSAKQRVAILAHIHETEGDILPLTDGGPVEFALDNHIFSVN